MKGARIAHAAVLLAHAALILALLWWCGAAAGSLLSLPLLASLPGLLRARVYTARWGTMLLVFYIAGFLAEGVAVPTRRGVGAALAVLALFDFLSLVAFARLQGRARAIAAARTESSAGAVH
jgi:uncharacterized membrane protein